MGPGRHRARPRPQPPRPRTRLLAGCTTAARTPPEHRSDRDLPSPRRSGGKPRRPHLALRAPARRRSLPIRQ
ncbi:hypothetical protein AMK68_04115 [candidate division KD3-62 bacterium DG_56]|uniref:Uncharacterized protein n=1 Tax=candidate division KD3-62 bacterium DG_56 TaxID=1704032 RepID=A0A0S7XKX7_9BACT|nr:MAG: hypothetical protein AMK68_04115 [candidate division KD3-62 bacterium DG_56]